MKRKQKKFVTETCLFYNLCFEKQLCYCYYSGASYFFDNEASHEKEKQDFKKKHKISTRNVEMVNCSLSEIGLLVFKDLFGRLYILDDTIKGEAFH